MKNRTKLLVTLATTLALMVVVGGLPFVFLVPLLYICCSRNLVTSLAAGLMYGIVSLCYAFMGSTIVSLAFVQMPWIAIVPRILAGLFAHLAFVATNKIIKKDGRFKRVFPINVGATVGSLSNTFLVVLCFWLFLSDLSTAGVTMLVYIPTMLISGIIELLVVNIITPPLTLTVNRALKLPNGCGKMGNNGGNAKKGVSL